MSLINSSRVEEYLARVSRIHPDLTPRWGRMDVAGMLAHVNLGLLTSIGEHEGGQYGPRWLATLVKPIGLRLPIPKGLPTTKELLKSDSDFLQEKEFFCELLKRVHREILGNPTAIHRHPAFGPMNRLEWAGLQSKHIDHHFKQFGL